MAILLDPTYLIGRPSRFGLFSVGGVAAVDRMTAARSRGRGPRSDPLTAGAGDATVPVDGGLGVDVEDTMTGLMDTAPGVEDKTEPEPDVEDTPPAFGGSETGDEEMVPATRCLKREDSDPNAGIFNFSSIGSESESEAEHNDLDDDAVYSQKSGGSLQQAFSVIPEAPKFLRRRVLELGALDVERQMLKAATGDQVISSVFSGTAGFEASAAWIVEALQSEMLDKQQNDMHRPGRLVIYSYCERDVDVVNFTGKIPEAMQPLHRFGSIRDRLYAQDRRRIEAIQKSYDEQAEELKAWRALDIEGRDWEWNKCTKGLPKSIRNDMMTELKQMEFKETRFCKSCLQVCSVSPWSVDEFRHTRWTEAGGDVCTPWSLMGALMGWLDEGAIDAMIWAYSSKYYGPHTILQECTPHFDSDVFTTILANVDDSPRSVYSFWAGNPNNTEERDSEEGRTKEEDTSWRVRV